MIAVKTVRFTKVLSLPGNRTSAVISSESARDAADFSMEWDPRMRILFVRHGSGKSCGYLGELIEHIEFDEAALDAFRKAPPVMQTALDKARKHTAAAQ
jgi:hypothetical protein